MRRSEDFTAAVRRGRRVGGPALVVHHLPGRANAADGAPLIGLVVSKAVGGSVVRHQVARRLRAQLSTRLSGLSPASATVVRALPRSASASSADLGAELDRAVTRLGSSA